MFSAIDRDLALLLTPRMLKMAILHFLLLRRMQTTEMWDQCARFLFRRLGQDASALLLHRLLLSYCGHARTSGWSIMGSSCLPQVITTDKHMSVSASPSPICNVVGYPETKPCQVQ